VGRYRRVLLIWNCFAILNIVAYWITALVLGGDAWNGGIRNGHYYLANHGRLTEVTRAVFEFSLWHTYVLMWIGAVTMVAQFRDPSAGTAAIGTSWGGASAPAGPDEDLEAGLVLHGLRACGIRCPWWQGSHSPSARHAEQAATVRDTAHRASIRLWAHRRGGAAPLLAAPVSGSCRRRLHLAAMRAATGKADSAVTGL
jgi:hypothetical protein